MPAAIPQMMVRINDLERWLQDFLFPLRPPRRIAVARCGRSTAGYGHRETDPRARPAAQRSSRRRPIPRSGRCLLRRRQLLLYTSGTTGRPKGVPRRQRAERAAALAQVGVDASHRRLAGVVQPHSLMLAAMAAICASETEGKCWRFYPPADPLQAALRLAPLIVPMIDLIQSAPAIQSARSSRRLGPLRRARRWSQSPSAGYARQPSKGRCRSAWLPA